MLPLLLLWIVIIRLSMIHETYELKLTGYAPEEDKFIETGMKIELHSKDGYG